MTPAPVKFLRAAKLATYAAQGANAPVEPLLAGTRQLEFSDGELRYRDIYAGTNFFVGYELVYRGARPIWSMAYSGGVVVEATSAAVAAIYAFLRGALRQVPEALPLRGPEHVVEGQLVYRCKTQGDPVRFSGVELIELAGSMVYELHFGGGLLVPESEA